MNRILTNIVGLALVALTASIAHSAPFSANADAEITGLWRFMQPVYMNGVKYTWPSADGSSSQVLSTNGSGTLSWVANSSTAMDDIGDPDANTSVDLTTYTLTMDSGATAADMFNFECTGNFGDVSCARIEQKTGNPTNGTVLEVISGDTDADALVVKANSVNTLVVNGNGTLSITGATDITGTLSGTGDVTLDDGVGASPSLTFTDQTNETAVFSKADSGKISVTTQAADGLQVLTGNLFVGNGTPGIITANGEDAYVEGDMEVGGNFYVAGTFLQDAIAPASAAPTTLTVDGSGAGGVTIGGTSTGAITLGGGATSVSLPAATDLTLAGGQISVTDTANSNVVSITNNTSTTASAIAITQNATTTGKVISVTADALNAGTMLYLDSDGIPASTYYIQGYNGSANDFLVGQYGATTITGNASTDVLTVTAGDVQITAGDIDLDNGQLMVDSVQDLANNITRNFNGAGTGAVLTVSDDHTASTNVALAVNQDGTAGSTAVSIVHDGDNPSIALTAGAARTGNVIDVDMANQEAEAAVYVDGAWTGASNEGLLWVNTTAAATIPAGHVVRLDQNGTGQHAAAIEGSVIYVADAATAPGAGTSYAVSIDATNIEALHVDTGTALFDEIATFTAGAQLNGDLAFDSDANTEEVTIETTATDFAAGSGLVQIHGDHAGNTNDMALLRLVYQADGDAQDTFIEAVDNSTGAAANGDTKFKVGTEGAITTVSTLTVGSYIVNTIMQENVTTEANITDPLTSSIVMINGDNDADNDTVDLQNGEADGQVAILTAGQNVDADDTISINYADTTCTNCAACTFDKTGESCTFVWDGTNSSWFQPSAPNTSL